MASSRRNTHTEAAKMEQVITAFFYKSLFIILESRSPDVSSCNYSVEQTLSSPCLSSSSSSSVRPRDEWFNLALRECPSVLENHDLCRQSNFEPVVVDVILEQNLSSEGQNSFFWNSDQEETCCETKGEKIIERWFVQHEGRKDRDCSLRSGRSNSNNLIMLYRKLILLLRSLYVTVRLLPAYNIFRDLNSSGQIRAFKLVPRVSSFVEPFTYKEEAEMQRFWFTPVDTSCGRLCLSVLYHSPISDPFSFGKGDCHGVRLSFNSLPQISFSGSLSRSLQIGFDYSEYPCPFDVKDNDMMDTVSRPKSYDRTGHPSDQNEAVYALVRMLEKAPPLHRDVSSSINFSEASKPEKWSNSIQEQNQISEAATVEHAAPSIIASVTTADALEELQAYKEMKNLLLGEGGKSYTSTNFASGAEYSSKGA